MRLKINHTLLSDSPYSKQNKNLFTVISRNYKHLINDIKFGTPASYLISGYRGSGKTSYIRKLEEIIRLEKLEKESQHNILGYQMKNKELKEIVFVQISFSKYQNQTFLLRKLIRGLYLEIKDHTSFKEMKISEAGLSNENKPATLLEQLYDKTFYDTSSNNIASQKKEKIFIFNIDFLLFLKFLIPLALFLFFLINSIIHKFDLSAIINYGGILFSLIAASGSFIKISAQKSRTKTEQEDFSRKSMYDDEIADYHFYNLLESFNKSYKVVFVLDELDKVNEDDIDKLLNEMKPYLVSGVAGFIVVSGQNLFYKYNKSKNEDDAILSSIFTKCIHIPLLSREEFQLLFEKMIIQGETLNPRETEIRKAYIDSLVFRSKRIPRKFIGLIREDIFWENGIAYIDVDETEKRYTIYTQILDILDEIDDIEIAVEGFDEAVRDFFLMQLFIKSHEILFSRKNSFSIAEILATVSQNNLYDQVKPFLETYITLLVKKFSTQKLLINNINQSDLYKVDFSIRKAETLAEPLEKPIINQLYELRNVALNVYYNLYTLNSPQQISLSNALIKLEEHDALSLRWKKQKEIFAALDTLDALGNDKEIQISLVKLLEEDQINPNKIIIELLGFYGTQKALHFFEEYDYKKLEIYNDNLDLILKNENSEKPLLLFEFKYRKTNVIPDEKLVFKSLSLIKDFANAENKNPFLFLIIFTDENFQFFERLKFKFRDVINEITEFQILHPYIKFLPISIGGLHLIDNAFEDFKKNNLQDLIHFDFQFQKPPANFPYRNDHFLNTIFELKRVNFRISIKPVNSKFWRLGLRFSKNNKFPAIEQERHINPDIGDVYLSVGEVLDSKIDDRGNPSFLTLGNINVTMMKDDLVSLENYDHSKVILEIVSNQDCSVTEFRVGVNGKSIGSRKFDLREFEYCKIFAWTDMVYFNLETDILIEHKLR